MIADRPSEGEDIAVLVRVLCTGRAGIQSGRRPDHLKDWLREATREKDLDTRQWDKLVSMTKLAFREGCILTELTWMMMLIILKCRRYYIGMGLVEVIWKVCDYTMNNSLRASITLNNTLYNFIKGRGTGTATMEAKLAPKLAGMVHGPLFQVFLDVQKSYN